MIECNDHNKNNRIYLQKVQKITARNITALVHKRFIFVSMAIILYALSINQKVYKL